jgi:pSer/pThr/pTyr-binding forkhead associated (FHA) protein
LTDPQPDEELPPLPVLEPAPAADGGVQVQGIVCSRGHFNDPTSIYCATCGISMVHQTHNLVPGPRPPLGVVVLDDGSVFPLSEDYVIGREPDNADDVRAGRALPLALDDPDALVSRVHARILLEGWDVRILDAGSSNGTFVAKPGDADWTRLVAQEPVTILPGTRVTMGSRSLVFDSYRKH